MDIIQQIITGPAEMLAKLLGKETESKHELIVEYSDPSTMDIDVMIFALLNHGKLNEAEDLLFERMRVQPSWDLFQAGLLFYSKLEDVSDENLENANFPRPEIEKGLSDFRRLYKASN